MRLWLQKTSIIGCFVFGAFYFVASPIFLYFIYQTLPHKLADPSFEFTARYSSNLTVLLLFFIVLSFSGILMMIAIIWKNRILMAPLMIGSIMNGLCLQQAPSTCVRTNSKFSRSDKH
ncbi:hypothetical protein ACKWTF_009472 [Chironomus riparius]